MSVDHQLLDTLPQDVPEAIRQMKRNLKRRIGDVDSLFDQVTQFIRAEVEDIEACTAKGESAWPVIDYADVEAGAVSQAQFDKLHRRGCVVIRNHYPREQALGWDSRLMAYLERNDFDRQYRGPGDDFFGSLSASRPEIYPIYWSPSQMEARQSDRMARVQAFLNRLWRFESEGQQWFDPDTNCIYPDRIRRRPPGTKSQGLGAHTDSGALERWLQPAYQKVFRHLFAGDFKRYDPWDAAYRAQVHEYQGGTTLCSAFRTFQGWTALSDMAPDQGSLFTVPIPAAMAYLLLRPLLDDVPEEDLCGVRPRRVLPVSEQWHSLLLRGKSLIPEVQAGDSVWWHCDMIHGVDSVDNQQGWANVMYIPASPLCDKNAAYAKQCALRFKQGESPDDFPNEHYEAHWPDRFREEQLNKNGRRSFCLE